MSTERKKLEFYIVTKDVSILKGPYRFLLNPQEYNRTVPIRIRPVQTKGGVFIDDFGPGVGTLSIKGIVKNEFVEENGRFLNLALERFKELQDYVVNQIFQNRRPGTPPDKYIAFYNHTDEEYFLTLPLGFSLQRSATKPLFYYYSIDLVILRALGQPPRDESASSLSESRIQSHIKSQIWGE